MNMVKNALAATKAFLERIPEKRKRIGLIAIVATLCAALAGVIMVTAGVFGTLDQPVAASNVTTASPSATSTSTSTTETTASATPTATETPGSDPATTAPADPATPVDSPVADPAVVDPAVVANPQAGGGINEVPAAQAPVASGGKKAVVPVAPAPVKKAVPAPAPAYVAPAPAPVAAPPVAPAPVAIPIAPAPAPPVAAPAPAYVQTYASINAARMRLGQPAFVAYIPGKCTLSAKATGSSLDGNENGIIQHPGVVGYPGAYTGATYVPSSDPGWPGGTLSVYGCLK